MNQTPDLSQEWHPIPKTYRTKKPPKKLHAGAKTKSWEDTRAELKKEFEKLGVTECELRLHGCWKTNALTFAHAEKRRFLAKEDLKTVILICSPCHLQIEFKPHEEMKKIVMDTIKKRSEMLSRL